MIKTIEYLLLVIIITMMSLIIFMIHQDLQSMSKSNEKIAENTTALIQMIESSKIYDLEN